MKACAAPYRARRISSAVQRACVESAVGMGVDQRCNLTQANGRGIYKTHPEVSFLLGACSYKVSSFEIDYTPRGTFGLPSPQAVQHNDWAGW